MAQTNPDKIFYSRLSLIAALVATFFLFPHVVCNQHNSMSLQWDSAIATNTLTNSLAGRWFHETVLNGPNVLGVHTQFIYLLLLPYFAVFHSPDWLFLLQLAMVYGCMPVIYLIAVEMGLTPASACLYSSLFYLIPVMLMMAIGPFLPGTFIFLFLLLSYLAYLKGNVRWFCVSALLAVSSGEQAALTYTALGAALLLTRKKANPQIAGRKQKFGYLSLGLGLGWILFSTWFIARMRVPGQVNAIATNYSDWNNDGSTLQLALNVVRHPAKALAMACDYTRWHYLLKTMSVLLPFAFTSVETIIVLSPVALYLLMKELEFTFWIHGYYFHSVFLAGTIGGIRLLLHWKNKIRHRAALLLGMGFINLGLFFTSFIAWDLHGLAGMAASTIKLHNAFQRIPPSATVLCQHRYCLYLANRLNLLVMDMRLPEPELKAAAERQYPLTGIHYDDINFIVCDLVNENDGPREAGFAKQERIDQRVKTMNSILATKKWRTVWYDDNVYILKKLSQSEEAIAPNPTEVQLKRP